MSRKFFRFGFLLLLIGGFFHTRAIGQLINVPSVVKEAFDKKFPEAKEVDWTNNIGSPEVKFKLNEEACRAKFNSKGEWIWTYTTISEEKIPSEVKLGLSKSKYAEWTVKKVTRIDKPDKTEYQLTVTKGSINSKNLLFTSEGRLLKNSYTI